jgi:hypothetical protein
MLSSTITFSTIVFNQYTWNRPAIEAFIVDRVAKILRLKAKTALVVIREFQVRWGS